MATFSENQVRQLYVVDADHPMEIVTDADNTYLYGSYTGVDGTLRTDIIDVDKILWAKSTDADALAEALKTVTVVLNPDVNGGEPVAGQDYVLRIVFKPFVGMSDEDNYVKHGFVRATSGMSATDFYTEMAISLYKNFSAEASTLVSITIGGSVVAGVRTISGELTPVDADGNAITADTTGIIITEVSQPWRRGLISKERVLFDVFTPPIKVDTDELEWGTITVGVADETIPDGYKIADLEYFLLGERGDVYRQISWPHSIDTEYLVDPTLEYHVLDIHYAYVGPNEGSQKSEKTLTIVAPDDNVIALNTIISAVNSAAGLSIATL